MSDSVPTHSAAWHYEQAERFMGLASHTDAGQVNGGRARAVDTYNQQLWATLACAHAQLAIAGATILAAGSHGREKASLMSHALGDGLRGT